MSGVEHLSQELQEKISRNNKRHLIQSDLFELFTQAGRDNEELKTTIKESLTVLLGYAKLEGIDISQITDV